MSVRVVRASLRRMWETWVCTVRREITSSAAMSGLDLPAATRSATRRSVGVRADQPVAGRRCRLRGPRRTPCARSRASARRTSQVAPRCVHTEALAAAERIDNDHLRAQLRDLLGVDALAAGDVATARAHLAAAADLHIGLFDQEGSAYCLDGLAAVALAQGKPDVPARLLGAARHAREVVGVSVWPWLQAIVDAGAAAVRAAAGVADFDRLTAEGARLRAVDALAYGLAVTGPESAARAAA